MTVYILTGHLGGGKTLFSVKQAQQYLQEGRRVASNMTFKLDHLCHWSNKRIYTKLPLIPRAADLHGLGKAYEGDYDEKKNGLIVLDEAGTWLNSQDWKDKDRRELFRWVTHARKLGWDVILIIQSYEALDKQIRESVSEVVLKAAHLNRILPLIGSMIPQVYMTTARYYNPQGPKLYRRYMFGKGYFGSYDTREAVKLETNISDDGEIIDARGCVSMLSAWHLKGRYRINPPPASDYAVAFVYTLLIALGAFLSIATFRSPRALFNAATKQLEPFLNDGTRFNVPELVKAS